MDLLTTSRTEAMALNAPRIRRVGAGDANPSSISVTNVSNIGKDFDSDETVDRTKQQQQQQQRMYLSNTKTSPRTKKFMLAACFTLSKLIVSYAVIFMMGSNYYFHVRLASSTNDEKNTVNQISPKFHPNKPQKIELKIRKENNKKQQHKLQQMRHASADQHLTPFFIINDWAEHLEQTKSYQERYGVESIRKYISAYIEPWYLFNDTIPRTGSRGDMKNDKDRGTPPDFVTPLPLRTHAPSDLRFYEYKHAATTCHEIPGKFPVDRGLEIDPVTGQNIIWNVGDKPTSLNFPWEEAPYCPVEADPFLPWIHDVFPGSPLDHPDHKEIADELQLRSSSIHFIAQNKRKCRTGTHFTENVNRLVPQVALFQSVSVQRISEEEAQRLAPSLWSPNTTILTDQEKQQQTRYRLAPYEEADHDGMYTRFICQFHTTIYNNDYDIAPHQVLLGETLSVYPFNYEFISYRKGQGGLLTAKGKDTMLFWTSNLHFECPIPEQLQSVIASGESILPDGTPTIRLDLIPIRSSARYRKVHLTEDMLGPVKDWGTPRYEAEEHWGASHVLPRIEASGRWTNIPICLPPQEPPPPPSSNTDVERQILEKKQEQDTQVVLQKKQTKEYSSTKHHYLSACLWASSAFKTRGMRKGSDTATNDRLIEWIEFHLMVGFDHIYLYDNSGAHTNETSLQPIVDMFHPSQITRIDWPSIICNNNIPAHDSTGERSSQYAAENSCRSRHAPFTEWIASFDTDEYFVPMGKYDNWKDILEDARGKGTNIISLRSSRGRLRMDKSTISADATSGGFEKSPDSLYLEAYNCDSAGSPKPSWAERARKQIYRADYVLYHFVHYSTVTQGYLYTYKNATDHGKTWKHHFGESSPSERESDELNEAVMVHTKTLTSDMTTGWQNKCLYNYTKKWQGCWAAFPWPLVNTKLGADDENDKKPYNEKGYEYNCHINEKVEDYWIPKLKQYLKKRRQINMIR